MKRLVTLLLTFAAAVANYAAWLGWDQKRTVHPDGSETGPYEAWQVIGLVIVLLVGGAYAAWRWYPAMVVIGVTAGLTLAVSYDWSDDDTGLWAVGATMVCVGTLMASSFVAAIVTMVRQVQRPAV
ncbi:hypothetical protein J4573_19025 [Actinomadura barringtoniae]|uniref:Uncharacterized protein n=1 Tax=Actinomadura barringtoniae TaxID=1427535 RepID=A0A939PAV6_9ACTN|nr:hypothetical protein [Actinomadura barringtoniae]MBO2449205.1 hypothetical protein [Actinomadura barringtoniae]